MGITHSDTKWWIKAVCWALVFTLVLFSLPAPRAHAFVIADDVALALLVGALAAVGITASAPKMADLTQGLQELLGDWELDRGLQTGTLIGLIANTATVIGAGAFQIGNSAWEKITDFVSFLQGEKGLDYSDPISSPSEDVISLDGVSYPYLTYTAINGSYAWDGVNYNSGVKFSATSEMLSADGDYIVYTFTPLTSGGYDSVRFTNHYGARYFEFYNTSTHQSYRLTTSSGYNNLYAWIGILINPSSHIAVMAGYMSSSSPSSYSTFNTASSYPLLKSYVSADYGNTGGFSVTQDYPDSDAPPLPYIPGKSLGVNVPGVSDRTLDGIAGGITEQVNEGTLTAVGSEADTEADTDFDIDGLGLQLVGSAMSTRFPWSLPWDIYGIFTLLSAEAEVPYWEVDFTPVFQNMGVPVGDGDAKLVIDLTDYNVIGVVSRWVCMVGFCLALALGTRKMIWK